MKICNKCNQEKELIQFSKDSKLKDGLKHRCKQCIKEYDIKYNKNNAIKIQQHYIENKELINIQSKHYYTNNKQKHLEKCIKQ